MKRAISCKTSRLGNGTIGESKGRWVDEPADSIIPSKFLVGVG